MDPTASNALILGLTTYKTDAISTVTAILPIALAVLVTVSLLLIAINFFKRVAGI
jgi:hypothetical protein